MGKEEEVKEGENMALAIKQNEATIIKKGMLSSFLNELHKSKVTEEYWAECVAARNVFSSSDVEKMKKMCNTEFIIPYEEDDELGKCTPMYLSINDNIYSIFGFE